MHCTTYKTAFFSYDILKKVFLMISLSSRTLSSSLVLEQKSLKQRLTHEMMTARLCLAVGAQIIQSNIGKQFFTCKPDRKTEGNLISFSQSIVFHFL